MRLLALCLLGQLIVAPKILAQQNDAQTARTDCTFADGYQLSLQYSTGKSEDPHNGKLWIPGGSPMILFAQSPLTLGNSGIAPGAYTVYAIPGKKEWTLIVNKNVAAGSKYDPSQDVARAPMETGEIDLPEKQLQLSFAHVAPKDCSLRLYYGKVGASAEFNER
jgi:Protein of unknown function (DUF2911)